MDVISTLHGVLVIEGPLSQRSIPLRAKPIRRYVLPYRGILGLALIAMSWSASWLQAGALGQYGFFSLWLGYILTLDALALRRNGTSLLTRNPKFFLGMFIAAVPLWWVFEGINQFTENWRYLGAEDYSTLRYTLVASWHFSIVVPAVFETTELIGSLNFVERFRRGPVLPVSRRLLTWAVALGLLSLLGLILWPRYTFPITWISLFLILDPINHLRGHPSIIGWLGRGDWRLPVALALGALVCGFFWEMWNYGAWPKWEYNIPFVHFGQIFEMPVLGYGGYFPFGLETFAAYHFMCGMVRRPVGEYLSIGASQTPTRPSANTEQEFTPA